MQANMRFASWIKASRLASQSYIFVPILFGQAYYYYRWQQIDWGLVVWLHLFGLFNQLYIVYANDYADQETDRLNTTFNLFSGGSRVLIDGDLSPLQLKRGAILMAVLCLLIAELFTLLYQRWWSIPIVVFALLLLWAYSYPPIKLSYRGGGESLQTIGVGLVLPIFAYYVQNGSLDGIPWQLFLIILPSQLACAMSTSLPVEPSDKKSNKKTASVLLGGQLTRILILVLNLASVLLAAFYSGLEISQSVRFSIVAIPLVSIIGMLILNRSQAGTKQLIAFNIFSVLCVLSLQLGFCFVFFSIS